MKLILVRHGETVGNLSGIKQGHLPGELTEKGLEQAKKLALRLKDENIDMIFSSDLKRAVDTTKEISKFHNVPVIYTTELRERCHGPFEGRHYSEYDKARKESGMDKIDFKFENSESYREIKERAGKFLKTLMKEHSGKAVLICSHNCFNRMLLGLLLKMPIEEAAELEQDNACINIVEIDRDKLKANKRKTCLINSTSHL